MFGLHGCVGTALDGYDRQQFTGLLNQQRAEMMQQHGLTSPEYRHWDRLLTLLKPLVD